MRRTAVFLDRDGVLNELAADGTPPRDLRAIRVTDGAATAVAEIHAAGLLAIIVTNQPEVARGTMTLETATAMSEAVRAGVSADFTYMCPHDSGDGCSCRKPLPGLLVRAADDHDLDLAKSWLIGDRWVDIAAARAAGVQPVLMERGDSWAPTSAGRPDATLAPDFRGPSLGACVHWILSRLSNDQAN